MTFLHSVGVAVVMFPLLAGISSCFHETDTVPFVDQLFPLVVGDRWVFQNERFDSTGALIDSWQDSVVFTGDTTIDGVQWTYHQYEQVLLGYRNTFKATLVRLIGPNTDSNSCVLYPAGYNFMESYFYPMPTVTGTRYWLNDTSYECHSVGSDYSVTVPAGTFRCEKFKIHDPGDQWYRVDFMATRAGWIRKDLFTKSSPGGSYFLHIRTVAISIPVKNAAG